MAAEVVDPGSGQGSGQGSGHPVLAGLGLVAQGLDLAGGDVWSLGDRELAAAVVDLDALTARAEAVTAALLREHITRETPDARGRQGARTVNLLKGRCRASAARAGAQVANAKVTCPHTGDLRALGAAWAAGQVSADHVGVARRTLTRLPKRIVREHGDQIDALLTEHARAFDPGDTDGLAQHLLSVVAPERADRYDEHAHERRHLGVVTDSTGMVLVRGQLDPAAGLCFTTTLDHLVQADRTTGTTGTTGGDSGDSGDSGTRGGAGEDGAVGGADLRTRGQRRVDALVTMATLAAEHLGLAPPPPPASDPPPTPATHTDTDTDTGAATEAAPDTDTGVATEAGPDVDTDTEVDTDTRAATDTGAATESAPDAEAETNASAETVPAADAAPEAESDAEAETWPDTASGAGSAALSGAGPGAGPAAWSGGCPCGGRRRIVRSVPRIVVVTTPDQLAGTPGAGPAVTTDGTLVDRGTLTRLACDAIIDRVVLGPTGRILATDTVGRLATPAQQVALAARDHGCTWPGCTVPPSLCEAHHVIWWSHGGPTTIDNLALLCRRHHTQIHTQPSQDAGDGWQLLMRDGIPWFRPPERLHPDRPLQRNTFHETGEATRRAGLRWATTTTQTTTRTTTGLTAPSEPEPP